MNREKYKYAMERVNTILQERLEQIRLSCTKPGQDPTDQQKLKAVRDGTATLRRDASLEDDLHNAFVFNIKVQEQFDKEKYDKLSKQVKEQAARVKDEIMFGNEQEAIKMIEKFRMNKG